MRKSQEYLCLFSSSISFILSSLLTAPLTFVSLLTELYQRATFANDSDSGHRRHHKGVHAIYRKSLNNCVTENVALLPTLPPECKRSDKGLAVCKISPVEEAVKAFASNTATSDGPMHRNSVGVAL